MTNSANRIAKYRQVTKRWCSFRGGRRYYLKSLWEINWAYYLEWLLQEGKIGEWKYEAETFWFEGIKRGVTNYTPDFIVTELDGSKTYYEVKGWLDSKSKTKLARMAKYYPEIRLILIQSEQYHDMIAKVGRLIGAETP